MNATLIAFGSGIERSYKVWFAGDTDIDLAGAANSGCMDVPVREQPTAGAEFGAIPPARHFSDCLALSKRARNM